MFRDELDSLHKELVVLSEQYSQKCLENAHLSRAIETERQALSSVARDNQELHARNQVCSSSTDNIFTSTVHLAPLLSVIDPFHSLTHVMLKVHFVLCINAEGFQMGKICSLWQNDNLQNPP